jgi:hypothetical protein
MQENPVDEWIVGGYISEFVQYTPTQVAVPNDGSDEVTTNMHIT